MNVSDLKMLRSGLGFYEEREDGSFSFRSRFGGSYYERIEEELTQQAKGNAAFSSPVLFTYAISTRGDVDGYKCLFYRENSKTVIYEVDLWEENGHIFTSISLFNQTFHGRFAKQEEQGLLTPAEDTWRRQRVQAVKQCLLESKPFRLRYVTGELS